jgi:cupin fold WbuC family metalloprotein|tara:strand:+ start:3452 stop:3940 length:489 start_codon:yes stop_codon:yes gene_type:complete
MENLNFRFNYKIPSLSSEDKIKYFEKASMSDRKRFPYIIHQKGDEFNQVFNFILEDSYMRPHMHPSENMIEKMHLVSGSFKLIFFDDKGIIKKTYDIDKKNSRVEVPGYTWHTYVMSSTSTIIFETMIGKYDPLTWKKMPEWAPNENNKEAEKYFRTLKNIK